MLAGVDIVDPTATVIDVDRAIGQDTTIEPFTTIKGRTRIGAAARSSTLPDRLPAGGRRQRRSVRVPAPGSTLRAGAKAGTSVGGQELGHRRGGESAAPCPTSATPTWARARTWGGHDHGQLRRPVQAPHDDRQARPRGVDTSFVAPVTVGDEAYTAAGLGRHRRRPRAGWRSLGQAAQCEKIRRATDARLHSETHEQRDRYERGVAGEPADRLQQAADAVSGRANPQLAIDIADKLGVDLGPIHAGRRFSPAGRMYCATRVDPGADRVHRAVDLGNPQTGITGPRRADGSCCS